MEEYLTEVLMADHIKAGFKVWGIEGTEQKIQELYRNKPGIQEKYLAVYKKLLQGG